MELFITYTFLDSTLSFLSCLYQNRCDTISKKQGLPKKVWRDTGLKQYDWLMDLYQYAIILHRLLSTTVLKLLSIQIQLVYKNILTRGNWNQIVK